MQLRLKVWVMVGVLTVCLWIAGCKGNGGGNVPAEDAKRLSAPPPPGGPSEAARRQIEEDAKKSKAPVAPPIPGAK